MIKIADQLLTTPQRFAKSDIRYWQAAVFQRVRNRGGTRQASKHFSVQLMAGGRRQEFNLGGKQQVSRGPQGPGDLRVPQSQRLGSDFCHV